MNTRTALLILALVLLTVFATAFALINYSNMVKVWPLMSYQPLTLIIGVSFVLGASISALLVSLIHQHREKMSFAPTRDATPTESTPQHEKPEGM